jgi:hypothetical protein
MEIGAGEEVVDGTASPMGITDARLDAAPVDYDAHLERIRAGDCFGLGAHVGPQGSCLVIIEHHIDVAVESYYDPETKLLVAEYLYDPMSDIEEWITGHADCREEPFLQCQFILCGDCDCP